jgi:hypothetical protein
VGQFDVGGLSDESFEQLDPLGWETDPAQVIQASSQGDFMDSVHAQAGQGDGFSAAQKLLHMAHYPVHIMSRFREEDFLGHQFAKRIPGKHLRNDDSSSPTCFWLKFQGDDGLAKRAALKDAPDAIELRLQPFEGQFLPDNLESCQACASDGRAAALGSRLKFVLNRRYAERTIEPVSIAEHRPDKFTRKRQVVLASKLNHLFHSLGNLRVQCPP